MTRCIVGADDGKNPPVFARSPGALTVRHRPIVSLVDPAGADTVDAVVTVRSTGDGVVGGPRPDSVEMIVIDASEGVTADE